MKSLRTIVVVLLCCCLLSCEPLDAINDGDGDRSNRLAAQTNVEGHLEEVTAPEVIRELSQRLTKYQPQVTIASPRQDVTVNQTDITVKIAVENLPLFEDDQLHLGNHLNLIVDNEPLQAIYSLEEPIVIANLAPGTHTVRILAVNAWGESFKNEGAFAQTTFNVLAETNDNRPDPNLPLLTYSNPTGSFGAEPVLLDFYLSDLDGVSTKNNPALQKLRVRATVNGESFIVENWQPYYLTGFAPGDNLIQLELIDQSGSAIANTFNNTARVFTYDPQQQDTLAKLVKNEVSASEARGIVDPSYYIQPVGTPEIIDFAEPDIPEPEIFSSELEDMPNKTSESDLLPAISKPETEMPELASSEVESNSEPDRATDLDNSIAIASDAQSRPENSVAVAETPANSSLESQIDASDQILDQVPDLDIAADNDAAEKVEPALKELETKTNEITITESNSASETVAQIVVPQAESVEIKDSDIAITVPALKSEPAPSPAKKSDQPLWWRKILVKIRRTIEAVAQKLPTEA
ncbi:MAG: hypothetical protein AAGM46_12700 [Cyanobacteria bacterium J06582_2]